MKSNLKKIILAIVILAIIAAAGFGVMQALSPKPTTVTIATLDSKSLAQTIVISGSLEANDTFETALGVTQKVLTVNKKAGDTVKAGDVLVQLDTADLTYQLNKAVLNLDLLKVSVTNAREQAAISLNTAQVAYEQAKKNDDDIRKKYNNGTVTRLVRDQSASALKTAENQVKLAQAVYDNLDLTSNTSDKKKQIDAAVIDIENLQRKIADSTVKSAISGKVALLDARENQFPTQQNSLIRVVDLSRLTIKANVNQYDAVLLKVGQKAAITVKGLAKAFAGVITSIGDVAVSAAGVSTEPKYEVTITIDPAADGAAGSAAGMSDGELKPGFEVDAAVTVNERQDALVVPLSAVLTENGQSSVFLVSDNKAVKMNVKTGLETNTQVEILEGLSAGEVYIPAPPAGLQNGDLVTAG